MSRTQPKRKPSASPVCYADEAGIAPGYMWAEHPPHPEPVEGRGAKRTRADSVVARAPRVKSKRKIKTTPKARKKSAHR